MSLQHLTPYHVFRDYDHLEKMKEGYSFTIDKEGYWICHDTAMGEGPIYRNQLAKLFSGSGDGFFKGKGLVFDETQKKYFLKAPPDDVYGVDVEDVPFLIVSVEYHPNHFSFFTNYDDQIDLQDPSQWRLDCFEGQDMPYLRVRANLWGRLSRNCYYDVIDRAQQKSENWGLVSGAHFFPLSRAGGHTK
jgi:hypothetical protein